MKKRLLFSVLISILCLSFISVQDVRAVTYTYQVDTLEDIIINSGCEDGDDDGDCSLRGAITRANSIGGSNIFVIMIPAGTYTFALGTPNENLNASGDLDLTAEIQLIGAGASTTIIDANDYDRVLEHRNIRPLTVSGLTLRNGTILDDGGGGGGVLLVSTGPTTFTDVIVEDNRVVGNDTLNDTGGGIALMSGTLVIENSTIQNNQAYSAGGIYTSGGDLTINDTLISGNTTNINNGLGGGIRQETTALVSLERCIISDNSALFGGGFSSSTVGQVMMIDTLFQNNDAYYGGGASIQNLASMERVSFAENQGYFGGGIFLVDSASSLQFINGTIAGNTAFQGGGVNMYDAGQASFTHATLAGNILTNLGSGSYGSELLIDFSYEEGSFSFSNSILSSIYPANACSINVDLLEYSSLGYNIGSDNTCRLTHITDQPGTNALLTGIRVYQNHAYATPGAGSPAIDAAGSAPGAYPTDQRGRLRVDGDLDGSVLPDIGAMEYFPFELFIGFLMK
jgi:hypothetical protein